MTKPTEPPTRYLLAADLDGTLIPSQEGDGPTEATASLDRLLGGREDILLAYVTGRHLGLALEGIREYRLPAPHFLSCDVGTSLYLRTNATFQIDPNYRRLMERALGGADAEDIRRTLASSSLLRLQEEAKQSDFKISFYFAGREAETRVVQETRRALRAVGATVDLVTSYEPETGRGLLDVLPAGVAKDFAVRHLHDQTGVDPDHVVYAGDSGNDLAAMLAGYRVIVVGNAPDDLKDRLREEGARNGLDRRIYFAREYFSAGVLEGLRHYRIL